MTWDTFVIMHFDKNIKTLISLFSTTSTFALKCKLQLFSMYEYDIIEVVLLGVPHENNNLKKSFLFSFLIFPISFSVLVFLLKHFSIEDQEYKRIGYTVERSNRIGSTHY